MAIVKSKFAWNRANQVVAAKALWLTTDYKTQVEEWMKERLNVWLTDNVPKQGSNYNPTPTNQQTNYVNADSNVTTWTQVGNAKSTVIEPTEEQKALEEQKKQQQKQVDDQKKASDDAAALKKEQDALLAKQKADAEIEATRAQTELEAEKFRQEAEYRKLEADNAARLEKEAKDEQAMLTAQKAIDDERNKASLVELEQKNKEEVANLEIQTTLNNTLSQVAFERLWMTFSWAAITWVQAVANQWLIQIATLKTKNANAYTDLSMKASEISLKYVDAINKSINEASKDVYNSKINLEDKVSSLRDNILLSKEDKAKAISKAVDDYIKGKNDSQDKMMKFISDKNKELKQSHDELLTTITKAQDSHKKTLEILISNWQINSRTKEEINELERKAWLPIGSTANMTMNSVYKSVTALAKEAWYGSDIPVVVLSKIMAYVQRAWTLNQPLDVAISNAFNTYASELPWYANKKKEEALSIDKINSDIAYIQSQITENVAQAKKAGSSWSWSKPKSEYDLALQWLNLRLKEAQAKKLEYDLLHPKGWDSDYLNAPEYNTTPSPTWGDDDSIE